MPSDEINTGPRTASFNVLESRVLVEAADAEEVQQWLDKATAGDFIVRLEDRLDEGAVVEVLISAGVMQVPLRCRVKQVFRSGLDRHGTMVEWLDREGAEAGDHAASAEVEHESKRSLFEPRRRSFRPRDSDESKAPAAESKDPEPELRSPESWAEETFPEVEEIRAEVLEAPSADEGLPDDGAFRPAGSVSSSDGGTSSASNIPVLTPRPLPKPIDGVETFDAESLNPDTDSGEEGNLDSLNDGGERARSRQRDDIQEAERGADELEALLSRSGEWRARAGIAVEAASVEAGSDGAEPAADATLQEESAQSTQPANEAKDSAGEGVRSGGDGGDGLSDDAKRTIAHGETRGVSLAHTINQMNPNEKARLATRASRQERRLLLRDHTFAVQMGLLNNPRTENKEILEIAKNPQTTGGILKRLASDRKFTNNYDIQVALVKHPGTPSPVAIRLLSQMRISDLRVLAKSQALRENVRKAALRLYLQRSP